MPNIDAEMAGIITERRRAIEDDAPCVGCGATLVTCRSYRGKDPTAPPWFGCCARTTAFLPCEHRPDTSALRELLREIESGHVRSLDQVLLDSVSPMTRFERRAAFARVLAGWSDPDTDYYGE